MVFPVEFFALNYSYACRVEEVSSISLAEALLRFTHLYIAFGLGRDFDTAHAEWRAFVAGINTEDPVFWIDRTYHRLVDGLPERIPDRPFGCFSYSLWEGGRVRLHFWNSAPGTSPLSREAMPTRIAELRELLEDVQHNHPEARAIVGGSWLYNIGAYRRLFPPVFLATAVPESPEPQFLSLWGQFLDHQCKVKPALAQVFLNRMNRAQTLEELLVCFPYPVLRLEAPVAVFYEHFDVRME